MTCLKKQVTINENLKLKR